MIKALIVRPFRPGDEARFADLEGYRFLRSDAPTAEELAEAEVILGGPTQEELGKAGRLRWLQLPMAGSNTYAAYPELRKPGVTLTNLSGAFGQSISEFVLAMVLMQYKHLHLFRDHQNECLWQDEGYQDSPVGKNLLILGAGNIGTETAKLFRPFGCRITGMRRTKRAVPPEYDDMILPDELDQALPQADIVVCALPESPETRGLLDDARLRRMKRGAILVNVGRGSLIDTDALAEVLNEGLLLGACIDVTDPEPLPPEHPLWKCRNCIITPHATGGSLGHLRATEDRLFGICRENLVRFRDGRPLLNRVDPATGYRVTEDRF